MASYAADLLFLQGYIADPALALSLRDDPATTTGLQPGPTVRDAPPGASPPEQSGDATPAAA